MSKSIARLVEIGAGQPTVVLEAGLNGGSDSWERVIPLLAPHVRVVAYDRVTTGRGDLAPGQSMVDDQIEVLASVITGQKTGACVLAGHSWGGLLIQLLACRHPDLVAGLVLVDPGHEDIESFLPFYLRWGWRIARTIVPDEMHGEGPAVIRAVREMRAAEKPLPDVPIIVLSAADGFPLPRRARATWTRRQAELAESVPRGRHVIVNETDHQVPVRRPDAVADAILEVVTQVRADRTDRR